MSALVLDAGAFLAVERGDRAMLARLRIAQQRDIGLRSNAVVVAQVWQDRAGRQAMLAGLLRAVEVCPVDERTGRDAGVLLAAWERPMWWMRRSLCSPVRATAS
ncbi:hypothetical protein [Frankia sp. AgKG'84/4]|uniref:hypothetical protein n=1 Tax=Frankia sp. AgKG'84/4 TaxID=573490 RepID=UPI002010BBE6|nr:hypothetical protein [Frankia sp. AgKG'84/4]MCL9792749.1 hypothetical protein [Frankia sp. AgKG'84/4]